jgi:anaerobic magnesium-protoporphyrin IX monomethyl ester cyclase
MKVTLINPPSPFLIDQKAFPPLGLLYLASALRQEDVEVEVVELAHQESRLAKALRDHLSSDIYGLTASTPQYPEALKILATLRAGAPAAQVVIGGSHPSSAPEVCLADGFDTVVVGEGEEAVRQIVKARRNGADIRGQFQVPYIENLDSVPYPARDLVDITSYGYEIDGGRGTTIITSRGCPYACSFCSKDVWQRSTRFHGVDYVVGEIEEIVNRHGFNRLLFLDDVLTLKPKRLLDLCARIEPLGLKWRCYARVDTTTREMLEAMKAAGCVEVGIGVESGSQRILDAVGKRTTVEGNAKFVRMCQAVGLPVNAFIMIGLPGETYETVEETRRWMEETRPDKFGFNIFSPFVGTPIHRHPENYDIRLYDMPDEKSWCKGRQGEYNAFVETSALSAAEILRLFTELFAYYTELTKWQPGVGKKAPEA